MCHRGYSGKVDLVDGSGLGGLSRPTLVGLVRRLLNRDIIPRSREKAKARRLHDCAPSSRNRKPDAALTSIGLAYDLHPKEIFQSGCRSTDGFATLTQIREGIQPGIGCREWVTDRRRGNADAPRGRIGVQGFSQWAKWTEVVVRAQRSYIGPPGVDVASVVRERPIISGGGR
jgi:hypothetical protein